MEKNKSEYLASLQIIIREQHGCGSIHIETVPVRERLPGQGEWIGEVEIFGLKHHPGARRCFAWAVSQRDEPELFVVRLEIPPVTSPEAAVHAYFSARENLPKS